MKVHSQFKARVEIAGTRMGAKNSSVGTSWSNLTSSSFYDLKSGTATPATVDAGLGFTWIRVQNTHVSQDLYVMLDAGGTSSTTDRMIVEPGGVLEEPLIGLDVTTVSVGGSASGTTYRATARFE